MEIIQANEKDLQAIMDLISKVVKNMLKKGIDQWNESYPSRDIILNDIKNNSLYLAKENNSYLGVVTLNEEQAPEYSNINWLTSNKKNLVVHRLAVHPDSQGKGIAKKLMEFAEELGRKSTYESIRLDTFSENPRAINFYKKCGYIKTGQVYFRHKTSPFPCFEKMLHSLPNNS